MVLRTTFAAAVGTETGTARVSELGQATAITPLPRRILSNMIKAEEDRKDSTSSTSTTVKDEEQEDRGRKQEREGSEGDRGEGAHSGDEEKDAAGKVKPERKRKRSRKDLDKKYACPTEGCGKSYSRAEHLYRHQLNRERDTAAGYPRHGLTLRFRHPEADIQMRLSRLSQVLCQTGPVRPTSREAHHPRVTPATEGQLLCRSGAGRKCTSDPCNGRWFWPRDASDRPLGQHWSLPPAVLRASVWSAAVPSGRARSIICDTTFG